MSQNYRRYVWLLMLLLVILFGLIARLFGNDEADASTTDINSYRAQNGVVQLEVDPNLQATSQAWAQELARSQELRHSDMSWALPGMTSAENVGYGPNYSTVFATFRNSSGHNANMLNPSWVTVGEGQAMSEDGTLWVVQHFSSGSYVEPQPQPPPPPSPSPPAASAPTPTIAPTTVTSIYTATIPPTPTTTVVWQEQIITVKPGRVRAVLDALFYLTAT